MSALAIIRRVRDAGGEITLADEAINLKIPASLRDGVVADITVSKDAIKRALKDEVSVPWDIEDYKALFDERAGIVEFDGCQTREKAEAKAFECCVVEWMNRHPCRSDPGRCAACDKPDRERHTVVPIGTESRGHAWLHPECWEEWHRVRKECARRALAAMGLAVPLGYPEGFHNVE